MSQWYEEIVFLHIVGVFGFLLAHGVPMFVGFKLRGERDREAIRALLKLSEASMAVALGSLLLVLVSGIGAGFIANWWSQGWIGTSLGLLVAMAVAMGGLGTPHNNKRNE